MAIEINVNEWMRLTPASRAIGVSRQRISQLVHSGALQTRVIFGVRCVRREDILLLKKARMARALLRQQSGA